MNNEHIQPDTDDETPTDMNTQVDTSNQQYQSFVDTEIADAIASIEVDTEMSDQEKQHYLETLRDPTSQDYKEVARNIVAEKIEEIESQEVSTPEELALLAVLKNKQQSEQIQIGTLDASQIPPQVMLQTLEKILCGQTRIDIARTIMEQDPTPQWLLPLMTLDKNDATHILSQRLRQVDPTSSRFSETKYAKHAHNIEKKVSEALHKRIYALIQQHIDDFEHTNAKLVKLIETVEKSIEVIKDNPTEVRQHVKLLDQLNERLDERTGKYLTQLHNLHNAQNRIFTTEK